MLLLSLLKSFSFSLYKASFLAFTKLIKILSYKEALAFSCLEKLRNSRREQSAKRWRGCGPPC